MSDRVDGRGTAPSRRGVLAAAGATAVGLAGVDPAAAQSGGPDYGGWFDDTSNFEGTADRTGQGTVRIAVGAKGNDGNYAFDPPAVRVDPGTTVVWEWTGKGGVHNVVDEAGEFESDLTDAAGHEFSHTVERSGVIKYACGPHRAMGMKGAVVVSDARSSTGSSAGPGVADLLTIGGGLGLVGTLLAVFTLGIRSETGDRRTDG